MTETRRCIRSASLGLSAASLFLLAGACSSGPSRVEEQQPSVSYSYEVGDQEEAKQQAAKYCHDNYARSARVVADESAGGGERVMTFECVRLQ